MNYKHDYHAGNFADVFKHWVLMLIVQNLQKKDSPLIYIDTHSGSGIYNLYSEQARATLEAQGGIQAVWKANSVLNGSLANYLDVVKKFQTEPNQLHYYPGSPCLVRTLLRRQDRMILNELHPDAVKLLKQKFRSDSQVHIHSQNAYQWLSAILPPPITRGIVFIDPPYEALDEYEQLLTLILTSMKRWSHGVYALWYPITKNQKFQLFFRSLKKSGIEKLLNVQLSNVEADSPLGLNGSGMLIINPPWQLDIQLNESLEKLWMILSPEHQGSYVLEH